MLIWMGLSTLHFNIPTYAAIDVDTVTNNNALKTAETDNLPTMHVYRKVSGRA